MNFNIKLKFNFPKALKSIFFIEFSFHFVYKIFFCIAISIWIFHIALSCVLEVYSLYVLTRTKMPTHHKFKSI